MIQPMRLLAVGTSYRDMTITTDIDTDIERVACAFIAKVAANFDLVNATLFGDNGGDAP